MFCLVAAVPWRFILTGTFGLQDRFFSGKLCFISFSLELINNVARLTFSDCILQNVRYWSHSWEVHSETDLCWQVTSIMGRSWIFSDNIRRLEIYQDIPRIFLDNIRRLKIYQGYFQTISDGWKYIRNIFRQYQEVAIYQGYVQTIFWDNIAMIFVMWWVGSSRQVTILGLCFPLTWISYVFPPHIFPSCVYFHSYISPLMYFLLWKPLMYFTPHIFPPSCIHPSCISPLMNFPLVYFPLICSIIITLSNVFCRLFTFMSVFEPGKALNTAPIHLPLTFVCNFAHKSDN